MSKFFWLFKHALLGASLTPLAVVLVLKLTPTNHGVGGVAMLSAYIGAPAGALIAPFIYWKNKSFSFGKNLLIVILLLSSSILGGWGLMYFVYSVYIKYFPSYDFLNSPVFLSLGAALLPSILLLLLKKWTLES
jgi:hypothetical protein